MDAAHPPTVDVSIDRSLPLLLLGFVAFLLLVVLYQCVRAYLAERDSLTGRDVATLVCLAAIYVLVALSLRPIVVCALSVCLCDDLHLLLRDALQRFFS